jgi:hypothetical protein
MDIFLTYRGRKYIIKTKINRANIDQTIDRAVEQICGKYLLSEMAEEGYVIVFDVKTHVGEVRAPQSRFLEGKEVLIFEIGIGRDWSRKMT